MSYIFDHNRVLLKIIQFFHCFNIFIQMRLLTLLIVFIPILSNGQTICSTESRNRLDSTLMALSKIDIAQKSMNELVLEVGTWFLNTPYVEKTLELPGDEKLVINLMGLDCTTFLESIVTLARMAKMGQFTYEEYESELEFLRYRDGARADYPSRLHYFSDWIYNNQQKGILRDITHDIGGEIYVNNPSFMSENPKLYLQLTNEEFIIQIKKSEAEIKTRTYYYLPKEAVKSHENKIKPGDLIAITISMDNMDISHVGIAIEQNGRIHLLHASSNAKKVEISKEPLSDYLLSHKSQSGIMVCRLKEPE